MTLESLKERQSKKGGEKPYLPATVTENAESIVITIPRKLAFSLIHESSTDKKTPMVTIVPLPPVGSDKKTPTVNMAVYENDPESTTNVVGRIGTFNLFL